MQLVPCGVSASAKARHKYHMDSEHLQCVQLGTARNEKAKMIWRLWNLTHHGDRGPAELGYMLCLLREATFVPHNFMASAPN